MTKIMSNEFTRIPLQKIVTYARNKLLVLKTDVNVKIRNRILAD